VLKFLKEAGLHQFSMPDRYLMGEYVGLQGKVFTLTFTSLYLYGEMPWLRS
jgi:hypothetical protein